MAMPESPIPPPMLASFSQSLGKLAEATQHASIATLTAAIVSARSKPTSIKEVLEIAHDIHFAMYPAPNHGAYIEWLKTKEQRLAKVYG